jgi:hypothetical protein
MNMAADMNHLFNILNHLAFERLSRNAML